MNAFQFSTAPLDTSALQREMRDVTCGGFAAFEGWVRNHNEGLAVTRLEYEAFAELAEKEGARIARASSEGFVAAARLLAQQRVVLHANCPVGHGALLRG